MSTKLFRVTFLIISLVLLFSLIVVFQSDTPEVDTQEELMDYYKEIYGEDCVIQLPRGDYARVWYAYADTGHENFKIDPIYGSDMYDELYTGDMFTCYSDKNTYKVGEEITILAEYHGSDPLVCGDGMLLEILVDGQWYPLNPNWYYPGEYGPLSSGKWGWLLNGYTLRRVNTYEYSEETGRYEFVSFSDRQLVQIQPGHYRFSSSDVRDTERRYRVSCEFDVVQ